MPEALTMNQFSTSVIALQARAPARMARMVTLAICCMAFLVMLYVYFARIDIVASAQGHIVPSGKTKVVQPLEAGVVRAIQVRDGQRVRAGDILVELDPTATTAERDRLQREAFEAEADASRLAALLQGNGRFDSPRDLPPEIAVNQQAMFVNRLAEQRSHLAAMDADIARRQADRDGVAGSLTQIRASLPLVRRKHEMREELAKTGHIAETGLIETKLELLNLEKELSVQQNRLAEASAGLNAALRQKEQAVAEYRARISSELADAARKRDMAHQDLIKATQRREQQTLRAPIDGVVQQLAVTTVGGVVTPAQQLMMVAPENSTLEVEAQVLNKDIGHIKAGQRAIVKIETYDFTRYGYIEGGVQWVGSDAMADPKLGLVYPVRIRLNAAETPNIVNGRKGAAAPGMSVTADVRVADRRMIEYFLAPLLRYKEESLRER
ncbi:MAG: HlyD family type I secretion periplasmic adaptor subunit [Sulfuricella denitrificans]|nr:HlyD family type I secretion periplasmic adaptor subunit [Sulfuricella denitrificans]